MEDEVRAFLASLESHPSYSESTRAAYSSDLRIFFEHLKITLNRMPTLADFTAAHIAGFLESEKRDGHQYSTLLRRRAALQRFEKHLLQKGLLEEVHLGSDVLINKRDTFLPEGAAQPLCLTDGQVQILLSTLRNSPKVLARRDYAILAVLLETGFSVSDLVDLDLTDLDLRACKIRLATPEPHGRWLGLGSAGEPVQIYLKLGRPELSHAKDEAALFISQNGARMSRQSMWQLMRHWGKLAGISGNLSPRTLRHTAALRLARAGRSTPEIQALLGHANPLSTLALLQRLKDPVYSETQLQQGAAGFTGEVIKNE